MEIKTQFECDDTVYFMEDNKVTSWTIKTFTVECELIYYAWYKTDCTIRYKINKYNPNKEYSFKEWEIFWTKDELLANL